MKNKKLCGIMYNEGRGGLILLSKEDIMTENIVKSITQAEEQAAQIKREALEQASAIVAQANERAAATENEVAKSCRSYKEAELKRAQADGEANYCATVQEIETAAKAYCAKVLENAPTVIGGIVGRILRGDC